MSCKSWQKNSKRLASSIFSWDFGPTNGVQSNMITPWEETGIRVSTHGPSNINHMHGSTPLGSANFATKWFMGIMENRWSNRNNANTNMLYISSNPNQLKTTGLETYLISNWKQRFTKNWYYGYKSQDGRAKRKIPSQR